MFLMKQGITHVKQHVITVTARPSAVPERVADPEKVQEIARTITQKLHRIQKNILELKQVKFYQHWCFQSVFFLSLCCFAVARNMKLLFLSYFCHLYSLSRRNIN